MVKGGSKCEAPGCPSVKRLNPELTFHCFPANLERARQWIIKCGRFDLLKQTNHHKKMQHSLCSLHFERHCFTNNLKNSLIKSAIPTVFDETGAIEQQPQWKKQQLFNSIESGQENAKKTCISQVQKLCRLCVNVIQDSEAIHLFGRASKKINLSDKINRLLPPDDQIVMCDFLPLWICHGCWKRVESCVETIDSFLAATIKLKSILTPAKRVDTLSETSAANDPHEVSDDFSTDDPNDASDGMDTEDNDGAMDEMEEEWLEEERAQYEHELNMSIQQKQEIRELCFSALSTINDSDINVKSTELLANKTRSTNSSSVNSEENFTRALLTNVDKTCENRNFLCRVCNQFFSTVDEVLLHRFKEHTEEDVLQARLKLRQRASAVRVVEVDGHSNTVDIQSFVDESQTLAV